MITRMQQRRGTSSEWLEVADTVILASGEMGLETDTGHFKIGDGQTVWTNLPYFKSDSHNSDTYAKLAADQDFLGTQNFIQSNPEKTPVIARGLDGHTSDLQQWVVESTVDNEPVIDKVAAMSSSGVLDLNGITISGDIVLSNNAKIRGLTNDNLQDDEAVNKAYVDTVGSAVNVLTPVRVATTENISTSGLITVDGVTLLAGDRVLVKNQTDKKLNGVYVAADSAWSRSTDMSNSITVKRGAYVLVEEGADNKNRSYILTTEGSGIGDAIDFGVDNITFELFFNPGAIVAGDGLTQNGLTFSAVGVEDQISVSGSGISIANTYPGQSSITTVGTIESGVWNGSTISVARGGTGANALTGFVYGNGTGAFTANPLISGSVINGDIAGRSSNVSGIIGISNGGTNAATPEQARANLGAAAASHTHPSSQVTGQENIVAGRVYSGGVSAGTPIRIFLQSTQPSNPANGDLWFW